MNTTLQTTIRNEIRLSGVGVHSGDRATVRLQPAGADAGIVFVSVANGGEIEIPALHSSVVSTARCTVLGNERGSIATVEHLMAAIAGLGIDNLLVEVDGPEMPIMDGSSAPFVEAILAVGIRAISAPRRYIKVLKPVRVQEGGASGELLPFDGRRVELEIRFDDELIGRQSYAFDFAGGSFARDVSRARTFGFLRDVETMWAKGLALGASLDNTLVVGEGEVVNPEGLRYADEFVRHKVLDAIGDLSLAGAPILGSYRSVRGGHRINAAVVSALMADPDAWSWSYGQPSGRRSAAHADLGARLPAAAYGPEVS
ncbi:UDP-3-O-acyl-N-acetylglucosamine deacetylase [Lutibaculum baratangense]|uniref:UDP-3-O-acyl-N-acetylglucosamine deacetylase n=1 Tax=Lutibaculum baratangense AMV1 TaxID=631454 RepID=V4RPX1_9HYPH|nr:UDP-3-O-acyl-N-acetylglucosamine deacetylase [Lutibaculum baratangense]ESR27324.1 UDP-3-O-[3-hydroxymyristoyl] N-acetylglucosamine deacetylase [Lutibaculum baratangense AMV1]